MADMAMKGNSKQRLCFREEIFGVKFPQKTAQPVPEPLDKSYASTSIMGEKKRAGYLPVNEGGTADDTIGPLFFY